MNPRPLSDGQNVQEERSISNTLSEWKKNTTTCVLVRTYIQKKHSICHFPVYYTHSSVSWLTQGVLEFQHWDYQWFFSIFVISDLLKFIDYPDWTEFYRKIFPNYNRNRFNGFFQDTLDSTDVTLKIAPL